MQIQPSAASDKCTKAFLRVILIVAQPFFICYSERSEAIPHMSF